MEGTDWILQHKLKDVYDNRNIERKDYDKSEEVWYTMYKFKDESKELNEFQPCCDQYQVDPITSLSYLPVCIMKDRDGKRGKMICGTKFTTITFEEGFDVKEKGSDLPDEELNELLVREFGIVLKEPIAFTAIMNKIRK